MFSALCCGCEQDRPAAVPDVTNSESNNPRLDLWQAAAQGELEIVKEIVYGGMNINTPVPPDRDLAGATPIQVAIHADQIHIVDFMIRSGAHVHKPANDEAGGEALHWAVQHHRLDAVKLLIEAGAKPYRKDKRGRSAVDLAEKLLADNSKIQSKILDTLKSESP